jgi:hypothetical protein
MNTNNSHFNMVSNANNNQHVHFNHHHMRTPGQILSLTSNIEFSPYASYLSDKTNQSPSNFLSCLSPPIGAALAATTNNSKLKINDSKSFVFKINRLGCKKQNQQHANNSKCKNFCKSRPGLSHHHHNHKSHRINGNLNHSHLMMMMNVNSTALNQTNNNNLLFSSSTNASSSLSNRCNMSVPGSTNNNSNTNTHNVSSAKLHAIDICQRKLTPLRWSKKLNKRKSIFKNLTLNANKSAVLKPLLKGKNSN